MSTFESGPTEAVLRDLRQPSPFPGDGGELIGRDPCVVPLGILSHHHRAKSPLKAIRERCLDCCCGVPSEVRKCTAVACPSWPFRLGSNPWRTKRVLSAEQKQAMAERFARAKGGGR